MNKKKSIMAVIAVIFIFMAVAAHADITISADVDKRQASLEDTFYLTVTVGGTRSTSAPPSVSGAGAFGITYRGSSSKVSIINGTMSSAIEYNYVLLPKKAGTFRLPPIILRHDGEIYKTAPIELVVTKPAAENAAKDIFVTAEISNSSPYVNEQVIFTFKFFTSVQIANATYENPVFKNFITEDLGETSSYQKVINGKQYTVNEVKYALFPLKAGEYPIAPLKGKADAVYRSKRRGRNSSIFDNPFFGGYAETKPVYFQTNELKLNVSPLPEYTNKEVPFSNLIGEFKITASLGTRSLDVGDSTTLTVTVHGYGNITDAAFPKLSELKNLKTYDDKPVEDIKATKGGIYGSKTFKKAFIPLKEGKQKLPVIKFSYFDTKKRDYVVLSTPEYTLDVSPSSVQENMNLVEMVGRTTTKEAVKVIGMDILPIKASINSLNNEEFRLFSIVNVLIALMPGLLYMVFMFYARQKEMHLADANILRRKKAYKKFTQATGNLNKLIKNDSTEFYGMLLNSLKNYIGDKLNSVGSAMTPKEVAAALAKNNIPQDVIRKVADAMERLERAQFASVKLLAADKKQLVKVLSFAAKTIERRVK